MVASDLEALAKRAEAEEIAPAIPFLWNDAAKLAWPKYNLHGADNDKFCEFRRLYDAGAYLDAADMLRPEGWQCDVLSSIDQGVAWTRVELWRPDEVEEAIGWVTGPHAEARARLAAALRARGAP